jgi:hypothetical protein
MDFTQNDFDETLQLSKYLKKIDHIDIGYVNLVSDEIFSSQPFFLTVLMGCRLDVLPEELDEIMKVYFLILEYFKNRKHVRTNKISKSHFEKVQERNIKMLHYSEGEPTQKDKAEIYSDNLQNLRSKALWAAVLFRFQRRPVLHKMNEEKRGVILIGIKTFIECFETI